MIGFLLFPPSGYSKVESKRESKSFRSRSLKKYQPSTPSIKRANTDSAKQTTLPKKSPDNVSAQPANGGIFYKNAPQAGAEVTLLDGKQLPNWLADLSTQPKDEQQVKSQKSRNQRSPEHVSSIINSHNEDIQNCYYNYLKLKPDVTGKLVVRIFVSPKGHVTKTEVVESNITDDVFLQKILSQIASWNDFGSCDQSKTMVYRQEYIFGE